MIKAQRVERIGQTTWFHLDVPDAEFPVQLGLQDGVIESYMGSLSIEDPADVVVLLIIDALVEGVESTIPRMNDPEVHHKIKFMLQHYSKEFNWNGLRDDVVNEAVISDEKVAAQVRDVWRLQRDFFIENPESEEGPADALYKAAKKMADGFKRQQEERLADEMVKELPRSARTQPRNSIANSVGFSIQI